MLIKRHGRGTLDLASEAWALRPKSAALLPRHMGSHLKPHCLLMIYSMSVTFPPTSNIESQHALNIHCTELVFTIIL